MKEAPVLRGYKVDLAYQGREKYESIELTETFVDHSSALASLSNIIHPSCTLFKLSKKHLKGENREGYLLNLQHAGFEERARMYMPVRWG